MKMNRQSRYRILWYEAAGFLLLMTMSWLDEFHSHWQESATECAAVFAVWMVVNYFTWRLISQLHYLEKFLRICAWCKKIEHEDHWVSLEQYVDQGLETKTTHGICPECAARFMEQSSGGDRTPDVRR